MNIFIALTGCLQTYRFGVAIVDTSRSTFSLFPQEVTHV
jgi:hypothetical protein